MIDTIIFDIGRVLVKFDWQEYLGRFSFDPETFELIGKAVFANPAWNEFDRGALSDEEIFSLFYASAPGYEKEIQSVIEDFPSSLTELSHTLPWITRLKEQGYKIYYLSNFPRTVHLKCGDALRFMDLCDGGLLSYEVCLIKPDPAFYKELFKRYNIIPDHAVFLDDLAANVDAGAKLGLHTILFDNYENASAKLNTLLLEKL